MNDYPGVMWMKVPVLKTLCIIHINFVKSHFFNRITD